MILKTSFSNIRHFNEQPLFSTPIPVGRLQDTATEREMIFEVQTNTNEGPRLFHEEACVSQAERHGRRPERWSANS